MTFIASSYKMGAKAHGKRKPGRPGKRQRLAAHAQHHTQRHMAFMKKRMREGASFTQAHKEAKQMVGR